MEEPAAVACRVCGRPLRTPESIARGVGPVCCPEVPGSPVATPRKRSAATGATAPDPRQLTLWAMPAEPEWQPCWAEPVECTGSYCDQVCFVRTRL